MQTHRTSLLFAKLEQHSAQSEPGLQYRRLNTQTRNSLVSFHSFHPCFTSSACTTHSYVWPSSLMLFRLHISNFSFILALHAKATYDIFSISLIPLQRLSIIHKQIPPISFVCFLLYPHIPSVLLFLYSNVKMPG